VPGAQLPAIFTSSGADGPNCHEICAELTGECDCVGSCFRPRNAAGDPLGSE
jgi:hypothetical protein